MDSLCSKNVGQNIDCVIEKDGKQYTVPVSWKHALEGNTVSTTVMVMTDLGKKPSSNVYVRKELRGCTVVKVGV